MKNHLLALIAALLGIVTSPLAAQTNTAAVLFPDEDLLTTENWKVVWPATPGLRYEVKQSTNLQSWTPRPAIPLPPVAPPNKCRFRRPAVPAISK